MKFLNKQSESLFFDQRGKRHNKNLYDQITFHQLISETPRAWVVHLNRFESKCEIYPKSQSHLYLSLDGGNNYIYVSKWLLKHREENGRDAITEAEKRRRERQPRRLRILDDRYGDAEDSPF